VAPRVGRVEASQGKSELFSSFGILWALRELSVVSRVMSGIVAAMPPKSPAAL
jgi:hypothetical protein